MMKYILPILLVIPFVSAQVVINQVLYDPIKTESGGEAVELKNIGSSAVDISGWILMTESSDADATLPSTVLQPGESFLVSDIGWDVNKDDSGWRSADYEEKITLGNADSGVALIADGDVVDAVGWGDAEESLFEGSPAVMVAVGNSLLRIEDSDDNSQDFVESAADFQDGIPVPVTAPITVSAPLIEVSKSLNLAPEGILSIKNNGGSAFQVKLVFNDFRFKNSTIPKSAVSVDGPVEFVVQPLSEHKSRISLKVPPNSVSGTYTSTIRVIYGS
jgi:hypothetical protein